MHGKLCGRPRQSGKTTLAKHLCSQAGCAIEEHYLNWDATKDREQIILERFPTVPGPLIAACHLRKGCVFPKSLQCNCTKARDRIGSTVTGSEFVRHTGFLRSWFNSISINIPGRKIGKDRGNPADLGLGSHNCPQIRLDCLHSRLKCLRLLIRGSNGR
jgi:hypothetical protein